MEELILIIMVINSILTGILLILFFRYILNKNSLKDPRITNEDAENIIKKTNKQETILCCLGLTSAVIFCIENIGASTSIASMTLSIVIVLIVMISIILKKVLEVKIADKLCLISMIILAVTFFMKPIYCSYYVSSNNITIGHSGVSCGNEGMLIEAFNTKFTQYEGRKTGAQVKTLLQEIISSNSNTENEDKLIEVEFLDEGGNPWTEVSFDKTKFNGSTAIKPNEKFNVRFEISDGNNSTSEIGYVYKCIISKANDNQSEYKSENNN